MDPALTSAPDLVAFFVPFLLAIACHEAAHAYVADRLGDPTARLAGRLTLNPLAHLDPLGALAFLFIKIGWAKPVPVNPLNFRNPVSDEIKVALAGPGSNILLGLLSAFLFNTVGRAMGGFAAQLLLASVYVNLLLAFFNLLPLPPLDGSKLLRPLLGFEQYLRLQQMGSFILIFFLIIVVNSYPQFFNLVLVPVKTLFQLFTGQSLAL
jgi:Zn-dependent protease